MKKLFLMAAAVSVALTGCVNDKSEDLGYKGDGKQEIAFDAPVIGSTTRAVFGPIANATYPEGETFHVSAVRSKDAKYTTWGAGEAFMEEEISFQTPDWKPSQPYYWPKKGYITFGAYSPNSIKTTYSATYGATGLTVTDFTTAANPDTHIDLMYAPRVFDKQSGVVPIEFRHALSWVDFKFKSTNVDAITLTDVIVNANSVGTFNETVTDQATTYASAPAWSGIKTPLNIIALATGSAKLQAEAAACGSKSLLLIPQEAGTNKITIKWKYTNGTSNVVEDEVTKDLSEVLAGGFEMNKHYTITVTINLDEITFAPTVKAWEAGAGTIEVPQP